MTWWAPKPVNKPAIEGSLFTYTDPKIDPPLTLRGDLVNKGSLVEKISNKKNSPPDKDPEDPMDMSKALDIIRSFITQPKPDVVKSQQQGQATVDAATSAIASFAKLVG